MYTHHIILILNPICTFLLVFKHTLTSFKFFFSLIKTHVVNMINFVLVIIRFQKFRCFPRSTHFFFVSRSRISSTTLLTMELFSCCLLHLFLGAGWLPWSLVGLHLTYLAQKSPRTLHSSEECPVLWMRQVFNFPNRRSTYRFLHLPAL